MNRGDVKLIIDRCIAHDVPDAADLIERQAAQINHLQMALADTEALEEETSARCLKQAAQIEQMRGALESFDGVFPVDQFDYYVMPSSKWDSLRKSALSTTPDQALEQFAKRVREQCAKVCENEYPYTVFHTDQRASINCAAAIRAITEIPK